MDLIAKKLWNFYFMDKFFAMETVYTDRKS